MNTIGDCKFRPIRAGEEYVIYDLIINVFHKSVAASYSMEGIETFHSMLSPSFIAEKNPDRFTIIAEHKKKIIGVLTISNKNHISLLFVDNDFQGHRIGSSLIQAGIEAIQINNSDLTVLTVNSSPNSLSFYRRN